MQWQTRSSSIQQLLCFYAHCSQCLYIHWNSRRRWQQLTMGKVIRAGNEPSRRLKIHNHRKGPCHRLLLVESPSPLWLLHWKPLKPNFRSAYRGFRPALVEAFSMIVNFAKVCFQLYKYLLQLTRTRHRRHHHRYESCQFCSPCELWLSARRGRETIINYTNIRRTIKTSHQGHQPSQTS